MPPVPGLTMIPNKSGGADPAMLDMLAKKAARLYLDHNMDLGDAVVKVASTEVASGQQFTTEHLRRITEFANNTAHQELFAKQADKNFTFPLADPDKVISELGKGAVNKIPVPSAQDAVASAMGKISSAQTFVPGMDGASLEDIFKTSGTNYPQYNSVGDLRILLDNVQAVEEEMLSKKAGAELLLDDTKERLFAHIKQASLYGLTLRDIDSALQQATGNPKLAEAVCTDAHAKLDQEAYYQLRNQTVKTASGTLNMEHPLVQSFIMLEKVSKQLVTFTKAAKIAGEQRARVSNFLHDKIRHAESAA